MGKKKTADERFDAKVMPVPESGCWLWTGSRSGRYGHFWTGTKNVSTHRYAYEKAKGPIPDGLTLDHLCRVTLCVNPDHLEPVPIQENQMRGHATRSRFNPRTHCPYGHPKTQEYIYRSPSNPSHRQCRACLGILGTQGRPSGSMLNAAKTHCPQGHPYTLENTYHPPGNPRRRHCRICIRNRAQFPGTGGVGIRNAAKTHCPKGHPYTPENTYRQPGNQRARYCRTCIAAKKTPF